MVGVVLIGATLLTAVLAAASLRLGSLVSTVLAVYLALVVNLAVVTRALSPFGAVTRPGVGGAEAALLAAAILVWWRGGRPVPSTAPALAVARSVMRDPVTGVFLGVVGCLLAYELALVLSVPPNNWDSLTYHLARTAAWFQHGGIYWIPNAPSANFNEFPSLAEQQILFMFVATGKGALFALPQYLAELASLVAVFGAARRLGFAPRASASAACLLATLSFVALESTTAQNDLFAASFPVVAACLILGGSRVELALAGVAVALGIGAKPTTVLVLPVLVWLVLLRGRRAIVPALAGGLAGLLAVGMWTYVFNAIHSGGLLGQGGWTTIGSPEQQSIRPGALSTVVDVVYQLMDVAPLSDHLIRFLAIGGAAAAAATLGYAAWRRWRPPAVVDAALVALPFLAPLLVVHGGDVIASLARSWGFPVRGSLGNVGPLNRVIDGATFGPVGAVVLVVVPLITLVAYARRRADGRQLALACALPVFLLFLSQATYNWFLTRFLLVPVVLTAPLFARLFRSRIVTASFLVVSAILAGMVVTQDPLRPLDGRNGFGRPWQLDQTAAVYLTDERGVGDAAAAFGRLVPRPACVGAVLDPNQPAYLLSGPRLEHDVFYLPVASALSEAYRHDLSYVVVSNGPNRWAAGSFHEDGWQVRPLGTYWLLAIARHAGDGDCR